MGNVDVKNAEKFLALAGKHLPSIKMEFMHGHFTYDDIFKISNNEYVLMSNLFWSYRPEFYDTAFHLWVGIKSSRDQRVSIKQVKQYLENWIREYKKLPVIKRDADFGRKFNLMMAERCIGALLVDIQNQNYKKTKGFLYGREIKFLDHKKNRRQNIIHLTKLFRKLFKYFTDKLEK